MLKQMLETIHVGLVKRSNFDMPKNDNLKYLRCLNFTKCKCKILFLRKLFYIIESAQIEVNQRYYPIKLS